MSCVFFLKFTHAKTDRLQPRGIEMRLRRLKATTIKWGRWNVNFKIEFCNQRPGIFQKNVFIIINIIIVAVVAVIGVIIIIIVLYISSSIIIIVIIIIIIIIFNWSEVFWRNSIF